MLELRNISVSLPNQQDGTKEILENINIVLDDSSFTVVTGPNGGGKSTLAKVIMGIMQPTSGQIFFDGKDITGMSITERAKLGISFAFQQPVRFKGLTVKDLLSLSTDKELDTNQLCDYLTEVGLCALEYIDRPLDDSLSGGEIKRIEIAASLARGSKFSMFDEPEAGIDLWSFQNLIKIFKKLHGNFGGAVLIISHQERILEIADRIIVLANGKIVDDGDKAEVFPRLLKDEEESCEFCCKTTKRGEKVE